MEEKSYPKSKKLVSKDGTIALTWDGKLHSLDGPALIPQGNNKLAEYHIFGIKYSKDQFLEMKKNQIGVPYHKTAAGKGAQRG